MENEIVIRANRKDGTLEILAKTNTGLRQWFPIRKTAVEEFVGKVKDAATFISSYESDYLELRIDN